MSKWFFKVLELGMNDIENTKKRPEKIPHIAVMRLSAMGDVAMLVPVLLAVVQQYPSVRLYWFGYPYHC
jgi:energy-converting hydrogenase Eha subunit F